MATVRWTVEPVIAGARLQIFWDEKRTLSNRVLAVRGYYLKQLLCIEAAGRPGQLRCRRARVERSVGLDFFVTFLVKQKSEDIKKSRYLILKENACSEAKEEEKHSILLFLFLFA